MITYSYDRAAYAKHQAGVVMVIVLVVLVSMMVAAVSVLRSADTAGVLTTNLAIRQSLIQEAEAVAQFVTTRIKDAAIFPKYTLAIAEENYQPTQMAENSRGVPLALAQLGPPSATGLTGYPHERWNGTTKVLARYVVDRICRTELDCAVAPAVGAANPGGDAFRERFGFNNGFYVRVTIRLDGPRNTVVYVQTVLR